MKTRQNYLLQQPEDMILPYNHSTCAPLAFWITNLRSMSKLTYHPKKLVINQNVSKQPFEQTQNIIIRDLENQEQSAADTHREHENYCYRVMNNESNRCCVITPYLRQHFQSFYSVQYCLVLETVTKKMKLSPKYASSKKSTIFYLTLSK